MVMKRQPRHVHFGRDIIVGTAEQGGLWSALTARGITAMVAADSEAGPLPRTEASRPR